MSEKYKVIDSKQPHFITLTLVGWVDLFNRKIYTDILDESFSHCINYKGLQIHGYVYMTSHLHLIVSSTKESIPSIVRDFKKHTNKQLIKAIVSYNESRREWLLNKFSYEANRISRASKYKLWQDGFHPVLLDSGHKIAQKLTYIHDNPLETGLITHSSYWHHSSYHAYYGSLIDSPNLPITKLF